MAGYLVSLDNIESLRLYAEHGVYATKLSAPSAGWAKHHEGTFADYATMQAGDNIYFFINRRIYGIGRLTVVGSDCKYFNYQGAGRPQVLEYEILKPSILWDEGTQSVNQRCICVFEPDPDMFKNGIDMDDVLSSKPSAFKMLRAFWKLSFVKFDDEENQAFRDIILKRIKYQSLLTVLCHGTACLHSVRHTHSCLIDSPMLIIPLVREWAQCCKRALMACGSNTRWHLKLEFFTSYRFKTHIPVLSLGSGIIYLIKL
jgi:hypothetical protein